MLRQLEKFTEVIRAKELNREESYWREVAIVKFELEEEKFASLKKKYKLEILDRQPHEIYIVQIAGPTERIDNFMQDVGNDQLIEIARTGVTAMDK